MGGIARRGIIPQPVLLCAACMVACGGVGGERSVGSRTISIVGTNDLHGNLESLPVLAGYVDNLRRLRSARGDAVVLVDAGDLFQGTLESNLVEGASVVRAYNALGYDHVAIGNHEFDYGPVGADSVVSEPGGDPRGALRARAREASFVFLNANLVFRDTKRRPGWDNVRPVSLQTVGGVTLGFVGVTTEDTLKTTLAANVRDLAVLPLASVVRDRARDLRARGARAVVVLAHAGGDCPPETGGPDVGRCDQDAEVFRLARALPARLVDVIVAGHTHRVVHHRVNGVAIIESLSSGRAFGRVDLEFRQGRLVHTRLFPMEPLCRTHGDGGGVPCDSVRYAGSVVSPSPTVARVITPDMRRAERLKSAPLFVRTVGSVAHDPFVESALGNLVATMMLKARPGAQVAMMNGGGVRAGLPAGVLTVGDWYEVLPFDDRLATVELPVAELAGIIGRNLTDDRGLWSVSGITAVARCEGGRVRVTVADEAGHALPLDRVVTVVTNDFVVTQADEPVWARASREGRVRVQANTLLRDAVAGALRGMPQPLDVGGHLDPLNPRVRYPGYPRRTPVVCPAASTR